VTGGARKPFNDRMLADAIYLGSREARKFWDQEYSDLKGLLNEVGLTNYSATFRAAAVEPAAMGSGIA
jgi:hypothetical protein